MFIHFNTVTFGKEEHESHFLLVCDSDRVTAVFVLSSACERARGSFSGGGNDGTQRTDGEKRGRRSDV